LGTPNLTGGPAPAGFHDSLEYNGRTVYYAVVDDTTFDCTGKNGGPFQSALDNETYFASQIVMGAVTNPDFDAWSADSYGYNTNEIGDVCQGQPGVLDERKSDGTHWAVHLAYGLDGFCNVDPNLTLVPTAFAGMSSMQVPIGSPNGNGMTIDIHSAFYGTDNATAVNFAVAGVPQGMGWSFAPQRTQASGSTDLFLSASKGMAPQSFSVEVTATAYGISHTVPVGVSLVACTPQSAGVACGGATCGTAPDGCGGTVTCGGTCQCPDGWYYNAAAHTCVHVKGGKCGGIGQPDCT
jgi:hypothetical protein